MVRMALAVTRFDIDQCGGCGAVSLADYPPRGGITRWLFRKYTGAGRAMPRSFDRRSG